MRKACFIFVVFIVAVTFFVGDHLFFWDTVQLASKHGHFFYENNFSRLILPPEIDSGHLPAFGMYIAFCWKLFGKTLAVSHFAMLPFLLGIGYYVLKTGAYLVGEREAPWLLLFVFADPVLAGQSILVSPDIVLVFFFLMGLYALWVSPSRWLLALAVTGLGLTSMRGMMVATGLFLFYFLCLGEKKSLNIFYKKIIPFVPGGLVAVAFLFYHWQQTGWVGYHAGSPWAPSYERVGWSGFLKNMVVLGWRLVDFGRVFEWMVLIFAGSLFFKNNKKLKGVVLQLGALMLIIFIVTIPSQLLYKALLAHRYFLPLFLTIHTLLFYFIFKKTNKGIRAFNVPRVVLASVVVVGLISGNGWIYPKKISQGWDSTLAHLPWYGLIADAQKFLDEKKINYVDVGTGFPNIGRRELYELDGRQYGFVQKDLRKNKYILYSNIMNDFTDGEIDELEANWSVVFQKEKRGVCLIIYRSKK